MKMEPAKKTTIKHLNYYVLSALVIGQTKAPMVERKLITLGLEPDRKNSFEFIRILRA
jgi:hypothetical protein